MTETIKAPFPWFGGKSKAAAQIWAAFGPANMIGNYVEPFFGSGAVWLGRPAAFDGWATVNDIDGHIANFWRSMRSDPGAVAEAACWPSNECDLHARHLALVTRRGALTERLMADPDYCEPTLAGWWAWGACVWIGSGWCSGEGPWVSVPDADGVPVFAKRDGDAGTGVNRKLPHLGDAGKGVNRNLPHLGNAGVGVNRQLPHLGNAGKGETIEARLAWITDWFTQLQDELCRVRVACGDWERICSAGTMTRNGIAAVVLDPPYGTTDEVYAHDSDTVTHDVLAWCESNGDNPALRIVLCGHEGQYAGLTGRGWACVKWDQKKGCGYTGAPDERERLWLSPHCHRADKTGGQTEMAL